MTVTVKRVGQGAAVALVLGLLALLIWRVAFSGGSRDFTLPRLDRPGQLSLESLRGKAVVLNFWASWCVPCKKEAPLFEQAWQKYRSRGLVVLGVNAQDFVGAARAFMRRYHLTYPQVHDGEGKTLEPWGLTGFPETFFLKRSGKVVLHEVGQVDAEELRHGIELALAS